MNIIENVISWVDFTNISLRKQENYFKKSFWEVKEHFNLKSPNLEDIILDIKLSRLFRANSQNILLKKYNDSEGLRDIIKILEIIYIQNTSHYWLNTLEHEFNNRLQYIKNFNKINWLEKGIIAWIKRYRNYLKIFLFAVVASFLLNKYGNFNWSEFRISANIMEAFSNSNDYNMFFSKLSIENNILLQLYDTIKNYLLNNLYILVKNEILGGALFLSVLWLIFFSLLYLINIVKRHWLQLIKICFIKFYLNYWSNRHINILLFYIAFFINTNNILQKRLEYFSKSK